MTTPTAAPPVDAVAAAVRPRIERISLVNPPVYRLLVLFTDGSKMEVNGRVWYCEFEALARAGKRIVVTPGIVSYQMCGG